MDWGGATSGAAWLSVASARAGVAEVCWLGIGGSPRATAAVPLEYEGAPALALLWAHADVAQEIAFSDTVAWVLSDRRLAQAGWQPLLGLGRARLIEDRNGVLFGAGMLDLELRKHPPSRSYADSPLLRRENWWFLPRLVLVFDVSDIGMVAERTAPDEQGVLAVTAGDGSLHVDTVSIDASTGAMSCTSIRGGAPMPRGDAVLLTHDFSVPDLERWPRRVTTGRWDGRSLNVVSRDEGRGLPPPPSLRERVRRHRVLERACRDALRDV